MSRLKATALHLAATLIALFVIFLVTRFLWYPAPLLTANGGWQTFELLAGVSLVLGPLLTAFVFRTGKKGLRLDLAVIGLLQLGSFAFCVHLLYARRIQMVVYSQHAFYGLDRARIALIGPKGQALLRASRKRPAYVYVHLPHNKMALMAVEIRTLRGEPPIFLRGWRYRAYTAKEQKRALTQGFPLAQIAQRNPKAAHALTAFRTHHKHLNHYTFMPFYGTQGAVIWALNRKNGHVIAVLPFNPGVGKV